MSSMGGGQDDNNNVDECCYHYPMQIITLMSGTSSDDLSPLKGAHLVVSYGPLHDRGGLVLGMLESCVDVQHVDLYM